MRRSVRSAKNAGVFALVRCALWILGRLSLDQALALADRLGELMYFTFRGTRQLARDHLQLAFGNSLSAAARDQIVRASFRNIIRCACEVAKFDTIRERLDEYVDTEGWQHLDAALAEGGAIVITGHIGNWELLGACTALRGVPVAAIARRIYNPRLNDLIVGFRERHGVRTILRESPHSSREILKVLRSRGILAMVIDQDTRAPSVSVPFFGRMARTPAAAAALALRRNLPVVPAFVQRRPGGGHRLTFLPAIRIAPSGDRRRDVLQLTRRFNETLEARIRTNPAEWIWWHRRWRYAPDPRLDLDAEVQ
ncbi:MAG: hypothetical protein A3J75_08750 [Acidobacteria bacterium RBG_16_68_9]|nr:MAG: hypothetical protein A3J75_08750 [Acidobacteria bacterium RBG_16_68_9]